MPDWSLLKAVNDPGILLDGRNKWAAAGRDPAKLHTDFRFFDLQPAPLSDWESAKAWWRVMFFRFIDKTYLERYAPIVDSVEENNEYFANSTWTDPQDAKRCIQSAQAACAVWSSEFRGRTVHSPDGGEGFIPDNCRVVVGNGPVTNTTPREYYQMVVDTDSILGMHPYSLWVNKQRAPDDWQNHSGLWLREEQRYGLKPRYLWSECGPYNGTSAGGWRISNCLNGDVALLVEAMRQWIRDVAKTDAYHEGRIVGPGAFFTSGGGAAWEHYELFTPQLSAIAQMLQSEWKPGVLNNVDHLTESLIREHANAILALVPFKPFQVKAKNPCALYDKPDGKLIKTITDQRTMDVFETVGAWYKVTQAAPIYWCKASATTDVL